MRLGIISLKRNLKKQNLISKKLLWKLLVQIQSVFLFVHLYHLPFLVVDGFGELIIDIVKNLLNLGLVWT